MTHDEFDRYVPLILGIVIDCSERQTAGVKNINIIKKALGSMMQHCLEPEDRVYLFFPENATVPERKGTAISQLLGYKPTDFELKTALEQSLYVMMLAEAEECRKYIFVVTDKDLDPQPLTRVQTLNERNEYGFQFILCNMGEKPDGITTWRLNKLSDLEQKISKFVRGLNGRRERNGEELQAD
jgi:hypothetical protein